MGRAGTVQTKIGREMPFKLDIALTHRNDTQLRERVTTRIFGGGGRGDSETSRVFQRTRLTLGGTTFVARNGVNSKL
jgi:hypothetical protein